MKKLQLCLLAALCVAIPVKADIVFDFSATGSCTGCENVLFQEDVTGNPLLGVTNQTSSIVSFSSTQEVDLETGASGQATLFAETGLLTNLTITMPDFFFGNLLFNLNAPADTTTTVTITAVDDEGQIFTSNLTELDENGENRTRVLAINGQSIASVTLDSSTGFEEIIQVRVGTLTPRDLGETPEIPEPASMLLIGTGLTAVAFIHRKRKQ